jgi:hypothetical protein
LVLTLRALAEARQAVATEKTLTLYARELARFSAEDARAAVRELAMTPRREGEPAFPSLGDLVARIREREARRAMQDRSRALIAEMERDFWLWVDATLADHPEETEQGLLDSIRTPGYRGRTARSVA